MNSALLTTNEVATMLGVGTSTIKRWADQGRLRCMKTEGGHRRFYSQDVRKLLHPDGPGSSLSADLMLKDQDGYSTLASILTLRAQCDSWAMAADHLFDFVKKERDEANTDDGGRERMRKLCKSVDCALVTSSKLALPRTEAAPTVAIFQPRRDQLSIATRLGEVVAAEAGMKSVRIADDVAGSTLSAQLDNTRVKAILLCASPEQLSPDAVDRLRHLAQQRQLPLALGGAARNEGYEQQASHPGEGVPAYVQYGTPVADYAALGQFLQSLAA